VILYFFNLTRWQEWYRSKGSLFLCCMYYAALSRGMAGAAVMFSMMGLMTLFCMLACFGHIANSYSDLAIDKAAGKENALALLPGGAAGGLVAAAGISGLAGSFILYGGRWDMIILWCVAFAMAMFYSLPPVRLKERGSLGLFAAAIAQRTLPAVIVFQAMKAWDRTAAAMCILGTLIGLRAILWHQLLDKETDRVSGVRTFVVNRGDGPARRLMQSVIFPMEMVALAAVIAGMTRKFPLMAVAGASLAIWDLGTALLHRRHHPHFAREFSAMVTKFYEVVFPLLLSVLLVRRDVRFGAVMLFTYLWLFGYRMARTLTRVLGSNYAWGKWRSHRPVDPVA
jgi:1,4-dihydroxy-2-naphthoate octaprenyltransferase